MTPEYVEGLADLADPEQLWKLAPLAQLDLPADRRRQLDAGVALRRYAGHLRQLNALIGTGRSLLITPLSPNSTAIKTVPSPKKRS